MADKNLIGGKYTVYLFLLQVFGQKNAIFLSFYKKNSKKFVGMKEYMYFCSRIKTKTLNI